MLRQLIRFLGVGAVATLLQYAILIGLVELAAFDPVLASATGFVISAVFNYLANYHLTFSSNQPHATAATRFVLVASIGLLLNTSSMYLLVDLLAAQYIVAQVLSTGVALIWNFHANRRWTYKAA
jgi:putative flippase GtrA